MTTKFLLLSCFKHVYIRGLAEDILRDKVFLVSEKDFVTMSNTRITIRKHPLKLIKYLFIKLWQNSQSVTYV